MIEITARARAFGAETEDTFVQVLNVKVDDLQDVASPPNSLSPYGSSDSCSDTL